jgi:superfamily II DNA or RNA helicase
LVDETHQSKCLSIKSCLEKSINAEYRVGLTGTLPDEKDYRMTIFGYLGPKMFSLKSSDLIKKGVLSKIKIANILMKYDEKVIYKYWHNENDNIQKQEYNDELDIIYNTDKRNGVFKYILNHIDSKDNILILCHKIDHLKSLKKYCEENFQNRKVHEIYGLTDANDRESIRLLADKSDSMIIIGTYATFGVGINIKKLHHVIFASSFRSKTKILQAIGRGLRTHESKSQVIIWDLIDDLTFINNWHGEDVIHKNFTYDHWEKRLEYYDNQGFEYFNKKINIRDL